MPRLPSSLLCCLAALGGFAPASRAAAGAPPAASPAGPTGRGSTEEIVQLSVFDVTTSRDIGYQSTNAAEVTRMNTPIENIPMNLTIFNQQFIDDLIATDTSEILAYEASSAKTTENDGFLLRGSSSAGSNFLNGFAQTSGNGSQPLANIERVEVIRGPAAVLYGGGGYGGTINRITKQPRPKADGSFRFILRDKRSYRAEFDCNTGAVPRTGNKLYLRINGIWEDGLTWFGQNRKEKSVAPSLTWQIAPKTRFTVEYMWNWRETQGSWETPVHAGDPRGMYTGDGVYHVMPRKINWNGNFNHPDKDLEYRHQTRQVASYNFTHAFNSHLNFRSQFQYENKEQLIYETQALSAYLTILRDAVLMPRGLRNLPVETDNYRTRNEVVWEGRTGPLKHRLLLGHGWVKQDDLNTSTIATRHSGGITNPTHLYGNGLIPAASTAASSIQKVYNYFPGITYAQFLADPTVAGFNARAYMPINVFDRANEGPAWIGSTRPLEAIDNKVRTINQANDLYANDVFSFLEDRAYVMGGLRYSKNFRRTWTYTTGTWPNKTVRTSPTPVDVKADATTYSVGAVYHLNHAKTLTLYANLNTSYSPVYNLQPDGSALDPEEGNQREVGLRFSFLDGRITGLVSYFRLLQENVVRADPARPGEGWYIQEQGALSRGYELSWNARVTDNWLVFGGFTDTDAYNKRTGLPQALQPQYRFTVFNRYSFDRGPLRGLNCNLGAIYTGTRPQTPTTERNEPAWRVPEWWRFDFIVGYNWKPQNARLRYSVSAKVTNLLDNQEIYYVASNSRYTLDPGRDAQLVFGVRF
jgi:iron complex outermembrane receptor protein